MIKEIVVLIAAIVIVIAVGVPIMLNPPANTIPILIYTQCFQDDPAVEGTCGANGGGNVFSEDWLVSNPEYSYDSDWESNSSNLCNEAYPYLDIYYAEPANYTDAVWQVKYWEGTEIIEENYTLWDNCVPLEGYIDIYIDSYTDLDGDCKLRFYCDGDDGYYFMKGEPD